MCNQTVKIRGKSETSYESPKEGEEGTEGQGKVWRSERKVGEFSRTFSCKQKPCVIFFWPSSLLGLRLKSESADMTFD